MANEKVIIEDWSVRDLEDNASIQVHYIGNYVTLDRSWMIHGNQYVKIYLVIDSSLKGKVEVKPLSSQPVAKEYPLPFSV